VEGDQVADSFDKAATEVCGGANLKRRRNR
jgi:hypothetical protein